MNDRDKEIKSNSDTYEIYLGTFIDDAFTWYSIKKFKDPTQAYKEFKKYVNTQLKYTDEELQQVWDTGRLDIELRQGNKLLNWVGIYSREVKVLSKEEEKEAEKGEIKKKKKDSLDMMYQLVFTLKTSLKWVANEQDIIDELGLDENYFVFDHVPTQEEVENKLIDTTSEMEKNFNENNQDDEFNGTKVYIDFYDIMLYPFEIKNYKSSIIKIYSDFSTSFVIGDSSVNDSVQALVRSPREEQIYNVIKNARGNDYTYTEIRSKEYAPGKFEIEVSCKVDAEKAKEIFKPGRTIEGEKFADQNSVIEFLENELNLKSLENFVVNRGVNEWVYQDDGTITGSIFIEEVPVVNDSTDFQTELEKFDRMIGTAEYEDVISQAEEVLDLASTKDELDAFRKTFAKIDEVDPRTTRNFYYMVQVKENQLKK